MSSLLAAKWRLCLLSAICLLLLTAFVTHAESTNETPAVQRIDATLKTLESQLEMHSIVEVQIVPHNDRMVSVEFAPGNNGAFLMSFDRSFLEGLSDDELTAVVAHELGHVWIFTHHPFLQTEALANEIAMRAVSREALAKVYAKLWTHLGTTGNLPEILGN